MTSANHSGRLPRTMTSTMKPASIGPTASTPSSPSVRRPLLSPSRRLRPGPAPFQPTHTNPRYMCFMMVILVTFSYYLLMNTLICGVIKVYQKIKTDGRYNKSLTRGQLELIDALNLMIRTRPGYRMVSPQLDDWFGWIRVRAYKFCMYDGLDEGKKVCEGGGGWGGGGGGA